MWLVGADRGVYGSGDALLAGSLGNLTLQAPIVAMAATPVAAIVPSSGDAG
jgi:hypothetical protein